MIIWFLCACTLARILSPSIYLISVGKVWYTQAQMNDVNYFYSNNLVVRYRQSRRSNVEMVSVKDFSSLWIFCAAWIDSDNPIPHHTFFFITNTPLKIKCSNVNVCVIFNQKYCKLSILYMSSGYSHIVKYASHASENIDDKNIFPDF